MTINIPTDLLVASASAITYNTALIGFDPRTLIGISGTPLLESFVQFLKDEWELPGRWAPMAAIAFGICLNLLLALFFHNDILSSVYAGLFTALLSSVWHEKILH
jgi:hypothetical protein